MGRRLAHDCDAFEGSDLETGEKVVLKLEHWNCRHPSLPEEHRIYQELDGAYGTAELKWYGTQGEDNMLVLEQLGPSLQDLFDYCGKPFTLKTVLMLAVQMLDRLEFVHSKHYIHRGVKPGNFVMGTGTNKYLCYIIDFGLSKKYWSSKSGHIPYFESRRDDLENLGYTLVYLLTGPLPWEKYIYTRNLSRDALHERIVKKKQSFKHTNLNFIPAEFKAFFVYKDTLDFEDTPDYGYLRSMFMDLFDTMGYTDDRIFDWDIEKEGLKLPPQIYVSRPCLHVNPVKPEPQAGITQFQSRANTPSNPPQINSIDQPPPQDHLVLGMELRVAKRYRFVGARLKSDCEVYGGVDVETGQEVVIKLEPLRAYHGGLINEIDFYEEINGAYGTAKFMWGGEEGDFDYRALVLERLGPSLQDLFDYCGKPFTLKTVLMLAVQMLDRLEFVHSKHYIHRGVKPGNFVMGTGSTKSICHIIDFDFSTTYIMTGNKEAKSHIPYSEGWRLTGNVIYASINNHLGIAQSRRDDIESLGYTLLYFLRGSLPWEDMVDTYQSNKQKRNRRILESKQAYAPERLCKGFPGEFNALFEYAAGLRFDEEPNYAYLKKTFQDLFDAQGFKDDGIFDWDIIKPAVSQLSRCSAAVRNQLITWIAQDAETSNHESLSKSKGDEEGKAKGAKMPNTASGGLKDHFALDNCTSGTAPKEEQSSLAQHLAEEPASLPQVPASTADSSSPLAEHPLLPGPNADEAASAQQLSASTAAAAASLAEQPPLKKHRVEQAPNLQASITDKDPPLAAQPHPQERQAEEEGSLHQVPAASTTTTTDALALVWARDHTE
eukprot:gene26778-32357_t